MKYVKMQNISLSFGTSIDHCRSLFYSGKFFKYINYRYAFFTFNYATGPYIYEALTKILIKYILSFKMHSNLI